MSEKATYTILDIPDPGELLRVLTAVKKGDFTSRLSSEYTGLAGKIADTLNDIIDLNQQLTKELSRISTVVGKQGRISQRATLGAPSGGWSAAIDSVNMLITDLT